MKRQGRVVITRLTPKPAATAVALALCARPADVLERRTYMKKGKPFASAYPRMRRNG